MIISGVAKLSKIRAAGVPQNVKMEQGIQIQRLSILFRRPLYCLNMGAQSYDPVCIECIFY